MAITKAKKVEILAKLDEGLKSAETVAFVNFHKLSVGEVSALRKSLREAGVSYYVAKKTLVKRALDARGVEGTQPELAGELALAWSKDPVASAKGVHEFAKIHKGKISLMGGVYQGKYFSKEEITTLASIPSMQGLRGQFVGMLNQSIASVVRVFDAKAKKEGEMVVLTEVKEEAKPEVSVEVSTPEETPVVATEAPAPAVEEAKPEEAAA